jgi:hypothetical protein
MVHLPDLVLKTRIYRRSRKLETGNGLIHQLLMGDGAHVAQAFKLDQLQLRQHAGQQPADRA